jgi:hypothetical protein
MIFFVSIFFSNSCKEVNTIQCCCKTNRNKTILSKQYIKAISIMYHIKDTKLEANSGIQIFL